MKTARILFVVFMGLGILLLLITRACNEARSKAEVEEKARAEYIASHPPTPPVHAVEALVLTDKCQTPCSAFVGWSYKVRTDGDPLRIKYNGCADWFDQPARGDFSAPKGFQPGEAQFVSPDEKNPHVQVWVYKKVTL